MAFERTVAEAVDILTKAQKLQARLERDFREMQDGEFAGNFVEAIMLQRRLESDDGELDGREIAIDPRMMRAAITALVAAMCREAERRQEKSDVIACDCPSCQAARN